MSKLRRTLSQLGFDEWAFLLCGVMAIAIADLDFVQVIHLSTEEALRIILVAIGLIMGAVATQAGKRSAELKELRDSLRATSSVELVDSESNIQQSIGRAKRFVLDTTLHLPRANLLHPVDNPNHFTYETVKPSCPRPNYLTVIRVW